jgi:hypothetical protein
LYVQLLVLSSVFRFFLYIILAVTLVASSYSTRTTPSSTVSLFSSTVSLFSPSHGSSRFLRNVGTYLLSCTVSHLRRPTIFHLSWLLDRRDRRWGGGGCCEVSGVSFQTLVFSVVTPRTAVDISEQTAASKWSSGREETKGRRRGRFRRGGVSSLSAHSAV